MKSFLIAFFFALFSFIAPTSNAEVAEHFFNDPANVHPDPNHTPGEYALPDTHAAKTVFQTLKSNLLTGDDLLDGSENLMTLGLGELTFTSIKNKTAKVLGYFRNYFGVATIERGQFRGMEMLVDLNSLDTAVPGRNNRIMDIFFNSTDPELGTAKVTFKEVDFGFHTFSKLADNQEYEASTVGTVELNGTTKEIEMKLLVKRQNDVWNVKTAEPIIILISDFSFNSRIFDLMKACNHKSMGNKVEVAVDLYFK